MGRVARRSIKLRGRNTADVCGRNIVVSARQIGPAHLGASEAGASEIAASTAFPKNTLSRAVNRIAKLGLIRRSAGESDRRQQNLTLTRKGRAVLDEALPRFIALEAEMLAPLSLVERETLSALMAKVVLAMFDGPPQETAPGERPARA